MQCVYQTRCCVLLHVYWRCHNVMCLVRHLCNGYTIHTHPHAHLLWLTHTHTHTTPPTVHTLQLTHAHTLHHTHTHYTTYTHTTTTQTHTHIHTHRHTHTHTHRQSTPATVSKQLLRVVTMWRSSALYRPRRGWSLEQCSPLWANYGPSFLGRWCWPYMSDCTASVCQGAKPATCKQ